MAGPALLSTYILTFNSGKYLARVLAAVQPISDDLVIIDSGSTDQTAEIAAHYHARFIYRKFDNFKNQRNFAQEQCRHNWVFNLDSDEVPTAACIAAIADLKQAGFHQQSNGPEAFRIERHWFLLGRKVHCFYPIDSPDFPVRLFRKDVVSFKTSSNFVHETPSGFTRSEKIAGPVHHYSCDSIQELYAKLNQYTSLAARDLQHRGKKATWSKLWLSPVGSWLKWYIKKGGFKDGYIGWILGRYAFEYSYQKYLKLKYDLETGPDSGSLETEDPVQLNVVRQSQLKDYQDETES
ncbi:MAG TPA: glycosyltransferase family 2 protein [Adhaeribacter sp.]|nr:glycosyltransferase family 2 protein [Adhaeribacter sp.]